MPIRLSASSSAAAAAVMCVFLGSWGCGSAPPRVVQWETARAWDAASARLGRAASRAAHGVTPDRGERQALRGAAEAAVEAGDLETAAALLEGLLNLRGDDYQLHWLAAQVALRRTNDVQAAITHLDVCLAQLPTQADCLELRALLRRDVGDAGGAAADLELLLDRHPDVVSAYEPLARLYRADGRLDEARRLVDLAIRTDSDEGVPLRLLRSGIFEDMGQYDRAEADLFYIVDAHHDRVVALGYLYRFYERSGAERDAGRVWQQIRAEMDRRTPDRRMRSL